jgi:RIO-like serine/threonine protein kinase
MKQEEATVLLNELGANKLVNPKLVLIENKEPNGYQLQIRGDYDRYAIALFIRKRKLSCKMENNYLTISTP